MAGKAARAAAARRKPRASRFAPLEDFAECVISADCPAGSHCDLGECVQACHDENPCEGDAVCSARGRCIEEGEEDVDPPVATEKVGEVSVEQPSVLLTESDTRLRITLESTSKDPVRYRVVPNGPHLSIEEPRGEFVETTTIELDVDSSELSGRDVPGTVRIRTTLGDLTVDCPIRAGMTGTYEGSMRYFVGDVPLGDTRVVFDLLEDHGDVSVRIDPDRSLLFPAADGEPSYGVGIFTVSEGLEFTVNHLVDETIGGSRNHFGRPIGREITFNISPTLSGTYEGTFEERIHGVFEQPVTVGGTIYLQKQPTDREPRFEFPGPVEMPEVEPGGQPAMKTLGVTASSATVVEDAADCNRSATTNAYTVSCLGMTEDTYYDSFRASLDATRTGSDPLGDIADLCEEEMILSHTDYLDLPDKDRECALPGGLGAVLREYSEYHSPSSTNSARGFHRVLARMLAAPLLVAQDKVVSGVRESFLTGLNSQKTLYTEAGEVLSGPAAFILHPAILEFSTGGRNPSRLRSAADPSHKLRAGSDHPGPAHSRSVRELGERFPLRAS